MLHAQLATFRHIDNRHNTFRLLDSINPNPPYQPDTTRTVDLPFSLRKWIRDSESCLNNVGAVRELFGGNYQSQILVYGNGPHELETHDDEETFLLQIVSFVAFMSQ